MKKLFCLAIMLLVTTQVQAIGFKGYVYSRTTILNENGNRTWCEYDENGEIVRDIAEAAGDYDPATVSVLSGDQYQAFVDQYEALKQDHPDMGLALSKADYQTAVFTTINGDTITKPALGPSTAYVAVRPQSELLLPDSSKLVLGEYPINPEIIISGATKSLLITASGEIKHDSTN